MLSCLLIVSCSKQDTTPPAAGNNGNGSSTSGAPKPSSAISVSIDGQPMTVTGSSKGRGSSTFEFSAWNSLQKVDVRCFWFYQQSGFNYMYSDSINYSTRPDSLSPWYTIRARNYGDVYFDCCMAPLTDSLVTGNYSGDFAPTPKQSLRIKGNFHLVFK